MSLRHVNGVVKLVLDGGQPQVLVTEHILGGEQRDDPHIYSVAVALLVPTKSSFFPFTPVVPIRFIRPFGAQLARPRKSYMEADYLLI